MFGHNFCLSTITTNIDNDADGNIDSRYLTTNTYTYDKQGNQLTSIFESDDGADGNIDFRSSTTNTYDKKGNVRFVG
ncbi:hypothetical protein IQ238_28105 [Pleurocapsales cyanobacterium LEGE 06147]|nr:hypothetical protein [Pleurocapsales cyanobacterium LEGE 06147]